MSQIIYLETIIEKSNHKISKKFDFSTIDTANIYLTKQVLKKENNLWFEVNNKYLDKFYEPIIFAVAVHFFENNYCEDKKTKPKIGDKYQKGNKRYEVIEVDCEINGIKNATKLKCISRKDKDSITITVSMDEYTRLKRATQPSNRNTFEPMQDFLQKTLGEKENIQSFPHKFAIVAPKNDFESCFELLDKRAFPYVYIANSGQKTENLPVNDPMFFVASSYEIIQEYIFDQDIKLEIIVFIDNKYNHQIQQDINRGYFKQAIFIGEQKPDVNCLKWHWTLPEYQYFDYSTQGGIKVNEVENTELTQLTKQFIDCAQKLERDFYIDLNSFKKRSEQVLGEEFSNTGEDYTEFHQQLVNDYAVILKQSYFKNNAKTHALQGEIKVNEVENTELTQLTKQFIDCIQKLEGDFYIDLKGLPAYIKYTYPLVILTDNSRLQNRIADLLHSFKKRSEQVLGEEFSNTGEDCTEFQQQLVNDYSVILKQFYFENNAKTKALKQQKETNYLLVPERQTLAVWQVEIKKLNWQKAKVISFSKLKTLSGQSTVTVLSLQDYDFYRSIRDSSHKINWLLYDNEYQQYKNFTRRYNNELIEEYRSKDRKKLTGIDYPDEIKTESVDDLVDRFWGSETDKERYTTTYQDHIDKKIIFDDGHKIELSANSTIILIDQQNKSREYKVSDLSIGDKIRIYENQHKEVLFDAISNNGENDNFNKILDHSELWKLQLEKYCANDKTTKTNEIATLCDVASSTVEGWLNKSNTKFPKNIKPLKDILGANYPIIYQSNKRYNSIMIALGRDLSDEVSDYIISKQKGKLLSELDDNTIKAISNSNMPIRIIKKITIIDRQTQ